MFEATPNKPLPRLGDPRKFAQQGVRLSGHVPLSAFERVCEVLADTSGNAGVELEFGISAERKLVVTGRAHADLVLTCQRCLNPVTVPIEADIALAIVIDEEGAKNLPRQLDPWILADEGNADLYQMVEDELLLNLPAVAYHPEPCIEVEFLSSGEPEVAPAKQNPFQVLEQLKGTPKK
ncbi:YceD family protein [Marinimicrobium sp. ABcell2]|uniref:YceD family protein n=1 Tax=Marinimicrobium sp. ABcell2 TaxID=3069751 RepID=UPI0027B5499A|nr:YceD family protein [Marinimicrobium sp. ABcell2]MDQ2075671.1 YceD family protein [Marinimicrobium sp. ABcell2]